MVFNSSEELLYLYLVLQLHSNSRSNHLLGFTDWKMVLSRHKVEVYFSFAHVMILQIHILVLLPQRPVFEVENKMLEKLADIMQTCCFCPYQVTSKISILSLYLSLKHEKRLEFKDFLLLIGFLTFALTNFHSSEKNSYNQSN